jgi:hypothetical protein
LARAPPRPSCPLGVFLQKKDELVLCFVAETPNSTAVAARYCKSVE